MTLLRRFAQTTRLEPSDPLYAFMKMVGSDPRVLRVARASRFRGRTRAALVRPERRRRHRDALLPSHGRRGGRAELDARELASARAESRERDRRDRLSGPRGGGFGIGRYEDHPGPDFRASRAAGRTLPTRAASCARPRRPPRSGSTSSSRSHGRRDESDLPAVLVLVLLLLLVVGGAGCEKAPAL